jgi:HK97 gp10 family phage protein
MSLKLDGVQETLNKLKNVNNKITREIDRELRAGANDIEKDAKRMAPANFGELRNSIGTEKVGLMRYSVFADAYHAPYIEFGTKKKTKVPADMSAVATAVKGRPKRGTFAEMVDNIQEWIKKKGIAATQISQVKTGKRKGQFKKSGALAQAIYERQLAFHIAKRILQNGINPQPFLYPAFIKNKAKLISTIQAVLNRATL